MKRSRRLTSKLGHKFRHLRWFCALKEAFHRQLYLYYFRRKKHRKALASAIRYFEACPLGLASVSALETAVEALVNNKRMGATKHWKRLGRGRIVAFGDIDEAKELALQAIAARRLCDAARYRRLSSYNDQRSLISRSHKLHAYLFSEKLPPLTCETHGSVFFQSEYNSLPSFQAFDNLSSPPAINFVHEPSANYAGVQQQLVSLIASELPKGAWGCTKGFRLDGSVNITFFIKQEADVLMSHGVADKNYFTRRDSRNKYLLNRYQHAFVPGMWLKNKILARPGIHLPPQNIHVVGWHRLDLLVQKRRDYRPGGRLRVLWAPTHNYQTQSNGRVLSSYPAFEQYTDKLQAAFDYEISLHPRNRPDKIPTMDKLANCDVLISDFGTMVYEALALGIPVIFPDWLVRDPIVETYKKSAPAELFKRNIGYHPSSFDELLEVLHAGPTVDKRSKDFIDHIIEPSTVGQSARIVAGTLLEIAQTAR
jgi:hypothetical protein